MKVVNVTHDDFANFSFSNSEALKSVGVDCKSFKLQTHPFNYSKESVIVSIEQMIEEVKDADVVQFFHDNISLFNIITPYCKCKKLIAYHTTSLYRRDYQILNQLMNPFIHKAVNCMPEFMGKGAKNEVYMVGAVDSEYLKTFKKEPKRPYIIGHYPSNPEVKGTKKIIELMKEVPGEGELYEFRYSAEQVSYQDQLKRIGECDIYIEMFTEKDGLGSEYGSFGITALEARGMDKIVVTQNTKGSIYEDTYALEESFFDVFNNDIEFIRTIEGLIGFTPNFLNNEYLGNSNFPHDYKTSGEYIIRNILND
jgi:hypothetical protein